MSTRDRLLALANTLIQQNGFEGFSYADLARGLGISKASIHHHFPTKTDLGIAYCGKKTNDFCFLEKEILKLSPGAGQLNAYLRAFSDCARDNEMCGVYAMLSDSNMFPTVLKDAVSLLAKYELCIVTGILTRGKKTGTLKFDVSPQEMAIIVCNALKGALLLNRIPPHSACERTIKALMIMLQC
ncbi:TPA: TetR/AcrR family transcriptional regulator [Morganella morganii]